MLETLSIIVVGGAIVVIMLWPLAQKGPHGEEEFFFELLRKFLPHDQKDETPAKRS